jgi:hypothetical protein
MLDRIRRGARHPLVIAGSVLAFVIACDAARNPLEVESSSRIPAGDVETPANAQLLVNGAIADFECAFGAYVLQSATVGEEFIYAQQTADRVPADRRNTIPTDPRYSTNLCGGPLTFLGIYTPLQIARAAAENILQYLKGWTDAEVPVNRTRLIGTAAAYAGYSLVMLGEGFCTMAISKINPDRSQEFGGEISRDSVFRLAIVRFSEAITAAQAAGPSDILNMAILGRARARLNVGDFAGARADALLIPAGFVKNATYSGTIPRRNNSVFSDNASGNTSSSIGEPYRSMTGDPRVPVTQGTSTSATGIRHWFQTKYTTIDAPIPLSTYEEAQLIIAEAEINAGNLPGALPILTAMRTRGNQGAFIGVTAADYTAELINQRRRELFLESHHLGDVIRYGIPLQPAAGTPHHFGGTYGNQLCFPLPAAERQNNPLIGN